jgi:proteic killer suppression protein
LHRLTGDRKAFWAVTINGPWRLVFRFEDGHAWDVEIVDYH